jgi:anti-sigma regulatory factor (Ser/Thr protein kinase)
MNVSAAVPVTETSQVAGARRIAQWLATDLGFAEDRAGKAALIATELATNLANHARGGEILLRPLCSETGEREGLEIAALDTGPGMDLGRSQRDGYSTTGTLGHGLGAVERLADAVDLYSNTSGTAIVATLRRTRANHEPAVRGRYTVGAVHVAKPGEEVCGDDWSWRLRDDRLTILVADGLGHGLLAHDAAVAAVAIFATGSGDPPARVIEDAHRRLRATRGAAVAMLAVDLARGTASYSGLGNITGAILQPGGGRQHLVSHNGTAGHTAARITEFNYAVASGSTFVLATDGLATNWNLAPYPGLGARSPSLIAAVLYRDFSRRRDDVTVVVAKERPPVAEKQ